jgi:hypothetical protein
VDNPGYALDSGLGRCSCTPGSAYILQTKLRLGHVVAILHVFRVKNKVEIFFCVIAIKFGESGALRGDKSDSSRRRKVTGKEAKGPSEGMNQSGPIFVRRKK